MKRILRQIGVCLGLTSLLLSYLPSGLAAGQGDLPESAYVPGVIGHAQWFSLSCESRSAADWAGFWGVSIDEAEFLSRLPSSDNPDEGFVGQAGDLWGMTPPRSYGVHAGPVASLLEDYGLAAEAQRGLSWDELRSEIAAGRPAIVWVIGQMWSGRARTYTAASGSTVQVAPFEHTMILVGYDRLSVQVVDAYTGLSLTYPVSTFLTSWGVLGNMAVTGEGQPSRPAGGSSSGTYTVVQGDYLVALARRFGLPWEELARMNGVLYPYVIYPGQVLKVSGQPEPAPPSPGPPPAAIPTAGPTAAGGSSRAGQNVRTWLPLVAGVGPQPASHDDEVRTYLVQRGDWLIVLADRWGIDWRELAERNGIAYPYIIYPGQVLTIED